MTLSNFHYSFEGENSNLKITSGPSCSWDTRMPNSSTNSQFYFSLLRHHHEAHYVLIPVLSVSMSLHKCSQASSQGCHSPVCLLTEMLWFGTPVFIVTCSVAWTCTWGLDFCPQRPLLPVIFLPRFWIRCHITPFLRSPQSVSITYH